MSLINLICATLAVATIASAFPFPIKLSQPVAITQESTLGYVRDSYQPYLEQTGYQMPPYPFEAPDFHQGFRPSQPVRPYSNPPSYNPDIFPSTSLQAPQKDSYDFFSQNYQENDNLSPLELDAELEAMQNLQPPRLPQFGEIDYYSAIKPKKTMPKKYYPGKMHVYVKNHQSGYKATAEINSDDDTKPVHDDDASFKINEHDYDNVHAPVVSAAEDEEHAEHNEETSADVVATEDGADSSKDASSNSPAIPETKIVSSGMNKEIATVM